MLIEKVKGTHSEEDKLILVTTYREPIRLSDIFLLIELFAENEFKRIQSSKLKKDILNGICPFLFEDKIEEIINRVKSKANEELNGDCRG